MLTNFFTTAVSNFDLYLFPTVQQQIVWCKTSDCSYLVEAASTAVWTLTLVIKTRSNHSTETVGSVVSFI